MPNLRVKDADGNVTGKKPVWFDPREYSFNRKNFRVGDADTSQKVGVYNFGLPLTETLEALFIRWIFYKAKQ